MTNEDEKNRLRVLDQKRPTEIGLKKQIHDILLEHGWVTVQVIDQARAALAQYPGKNLAQILLEKAQVSEEKYFRAVAERNNLPFADIGDLKLDLPFIRTFSEHLVKKYRILPVGKEGNHLVIGTYDPERPALFTALKSNGFMFVKLVVLPATQVEDFLEKRVFRAHELLEDVSIENLVEKARIQFQAYDLQSGGLIERGGGLTEVLSHEQAAIINLVNKTLLSAVQKRASDIHLEPEEKQIVIRFRVDGALRQELSIEPHVYQAFMIRVKIIANLDITEKGAPQDGAFKLQIDDRGVDFRVAIIPSLYGEAVVIRLLSSTKVSANLTTLGILSEHLPLIEEKIKSSHGMILVSGATGSGKSTTLHSFLTILNHPEKKIITVEDPVENRIRGILQIPIIQNKVDHNKNLTFARALRSILRLDPDIIMVGEIRDGETANIALTAALTGHLLLTSIHANSAVRVVYRLLELGCEKSALVSCLRLIIAQKLVRLTCKSCRRPLNLTPQHMKLLDLPNDYAAMCEIYNGVGCNRCSGTGYLDRVGLFEIINFEAALGRLVLENRSAEEIEAHLTEQGFLTIVDQCRIKVIEGLVSMEEYLAVKIYN